MSECKCTCKCTANARAKVVQRVEGRGQRVEGRGSCGYVTSNLQLPNVREKMEFGGCHADA